MKKIYSLLFITFSCLSVSAQTPDKNLVIDSLVEINLLESLLDSLDKPKSYFEISLGVGNKLFSVHNNAINSAATQEKKLFYTPSIAYYHKSGFNISLTPYITSDSSAIKVYQTALTPGYDFASNNIGFGISYTRYLADTKSYNSKATYQNDLYAYFKYTKSFIEPSISIGFAEGKYKEINLVTIPILGIPKLFKDSVTNSIKDFSLSVGIEHGFSFDSVFSTKGNLLFTPQLVLNAGSEKFTAAHTNKNLATFVQKSKKLKSKSLTQSANSAFALQSLALSLSTAYTIGNFSISPNLYIDYYLPATTENRLSTIFSLTIGYSF